MNRMKNCKKQNFIKICQGEDLQMQLSLRSTNPTEYNLICMKVNGACDLISKFFYKPLPPLTSFHGEKIASNTRSMYQSQY